MTDWEELQPEFRRVVLRRTGPIREVADEIQVTTRSVHRMIAGKVTPTRLTQASVERFILRHVSQSEGWAPGD